MREITTWEVFRTGQQNRPVTVQALIAKVRNGHLVFTNDEFDEERAPLAVFATGEWASFRQKQMPAPAPVGVEIAVTKRTTAAIADEIAEAARGLLSRLPLDTLATGEGPLGFRLTLTPCAAPSETDECAMTPRR